MIPLTTLTALLIGAIALGTSSGFAANAAAGAAKAIAWRIIGLINFLTFCMFFSPPSLKISNFQTPNSKIWNLGLGPW